jgi:hypothetical protein
VHARRFGLFRFRSPLLSESLLMYFPPGTEMVHFPGLARTRLWIQRAVPEVYSGGFPHSEIPGSKPACGSPRLIAACHVLHRLLAPRHPPYALSSLTIKLTQAVAAIRIRMAVLSSAAARDRRSATQSAAGVSSPFHKLLCSSRICRERTASPHSSECSRRCALPTYSVVKERCVRFCRTAPLPAGRSPLFESRRETNKKPGVERRANPPTLPRAASRDARLLSILYS